MTGFIDTNSDINISVVGDNNYVSGMTVASFVDLGYIVLPSSYDQQVELIV